MVQVNGTRDEVQRLSKERAGSVKYSTKWPWRIDSPPAAILAIPTSGGLSGPPPSRLCPEVGTDESYSSIWSRDGCTGLPTFAFCSLSKIAQAPSSCQAL